MGQNWRRPLGILLLSLAVLLGMPMAALSMSGDESDISGEVAADVLSSAPALASSVTLPSIDERTVYHTPGSDYKGGDCILTATKCMLRRAALYKGSAIWSSITNKAIRGKAAPNGALLNSFSYSAGGLRFKVGCGNFSDVSGLATKAEKNAARKQEIAQLLADNKNMSRYGIVAWGYNAARSGMHGCLVVSCDGDTIEAIDSVYNVGSPNEGIQLWEDTSMKDPYLVTKYWYITSVSGKAADAGADGTVPSTLEISGVRQPSSIVHGKAFSIKGVVESNYRISSVIVTIIDAAGSEVIRVSGEAGGWSYDIYDELDRDVRFGTLDVGNYTYRVSASDEQKELTLLHENAFSITPNARDKTNGVTSDKGGPDGSGAGSSGNQESGSNSVGSDTSGSASDNAPVFRITNARSPVTVKKRLGFKIKGIITSDTDITRVTVRVETTDGKKKISVSARPYGNTYDLADIEPRVRFRKLKKGRYVYKVIARSTSGSKTLIKRKFRVI